MVIGLTNGHCKAIAELWREERRSDADIGAILRSAHVLNGRDKIIRKQKIVRWESQRL